MSHDYESPTKVSYFSSVFCISLPPAFQARYGMEGLMVSFRGFYEKCALERDDYDPKYAAFLREVASSYPEIDNTGLYRVDRDSRGNAVFDFDDWDELSHDQKLNRGSINAAIAVLDRLRRDLEETGYGPEDADRVNTVRRKLAEIVRHWDDIPRMTMDERFARMRDLDVRVAEA